METDVILGFLNIDPEEVKCNLERDLFTITDSKFNEMLSKIYFLASKA